MPRSDVSSPPRLPGRFITLEGGEGAGKSTQSQAIAEALRNAGIETLVTREPGGTPEGEQLRSLLKYGPEWDGLAETLLHFAARAQHVAKVIKPALEHGVWVVCDRYYDSTMAYQGYGQGADRARIATLSGWLGLDPDLTLVMDAPVSTSAARMASRMAAKSMAARSRAPGRPQDRYESLGQAFFEQVRAAFRDIAALHPQRCVLIDAAGTPGDVTEQALHHMAQRLDDPRLKRFSQMDRRA